MRPGRHDREMVRGVQLNLRLDPELVAKLDQLGSVFPGLTRAIVARQALLRGVEELLKERGEKKGKR